MRIFTDNLKIIMQDSDITVKELSEYLGVDRRKVYTWLSGKRRSFPNILELHKICELLGIDDIEVFFDETRLDEAIKDTVAQDK